MSADWLCASTQQIEVSVFSRDFSQFRRSFSATCYCLWNNKYRSIGVWAKIRERHFSRTSFIIMCTKSLSANDEENVSLQHGRGGGGEVYKNRWWISLVKNYLSGKKEKGEADVKNAWSLNKHRYSHYSRARADPVVPSKRKMKIKVFWFLLRVFTTVCSVTFSTPTKNTKIKKKTK